VDERKPRRLLRRRVVEDRCGIGTTYLYELIARGAFPRPVPIGRRAVAWLEDEIEAWIEERVKARSEGRGADR
jgi:prophage regulatory protein